MKTGLIRQPAGLGDIFFTQKIARILLNSKRADSIIWPVIKEYDYLSDYMVNDSVTFISEKEVFPFKEVYESNQLQIIENDNVLYIPLQHADMMIPNLSVMQVKYALCGLEYNDWKNYFSFKRNYEREKTLKDYLKLGDEPYNLVNVNFGSKDYSYLNNKRKGIDINNGYRTIEAGYFGFDNIFDWLGVLEGAVEVHTVDTVWCYLAEKLNLKNLTVYSRKPGNAEFFKYVEGIFSPNWKYVL
jgi:hypothetical protein